MLVSLLGRVVLEAQFDSLFRVPIMRNIVFGLGLAIATGLSASAQVTITNLGVLTGGWTSDAGSISRDGSTVVGRSSTSNGDRAFRWTSAGGMQSLGLIAQGSNASSYAEKTNADGSVVIGSCALPHNNYASWRGFRWTASQGMTELQPYTSQGNNFYSSARAVSGDGLVTFGQTSNSNGTNAAKWDVSGAVTVLSTTAGSVATACTTDGAFAVGTANSQAVRWSATGSEFAISITGSTQAHARAISDNGLIITGDCTVGGVTQAFRWTQSGGATRLGLLAGGDYSQGYGMSADGSVIVGQAASAFGSRAFLWTEATGMVDLNAYLSSMGVDLSGWTLKYAAGVSADGSVISGTGEFNGAQRAFVVTGLSIPSPATLPLIALALVACRKRRL